VQGRSHPSVPAEVVATVMVLQALEGLSDREAISALRREIVWKVACGLRLDEGGFHPTVLVYWRNRIRNTEPTAERTNQHRPQERRSRPGPERAAG
ncbi:MAG: transposase, partial [Actinomycetes bacterium]